VLEIIEHLEIQAHLPDMIISAQVSSAVCILTTLCYRKNSLSPTPLSTSDSFTICD